MKKFTCLMVIMALCSGFTFCTFAQNFNDISGHWANGDITYLTERGIIKGVTEEEFIPDNNITRAEFAALTLRALKIDDSLYTYNYLYDDVEPGDWFADTLQACHTIGITDFHLWDDGSFHPDEFITREEMASFVVNAYNLITEYKIVGGDISNFEDKDDVSSWALMYVGAAYQLDIIKGVTSDLIRPDHNATRAQAAAVVRRMIAISSLSVDWR